MGHAVVSWKTGHWTRFGVAPLSDKTSAIGTSAEGARARVVGASRDSFPPP